MNRDYSHVLAHFYGAPWAILPEKLAEIEAVLWRRIATGPMLSEDPMPKEKPIRMEEGYSLHGAAAVVPISGTITPRPSLFSDWSGGSSAMGISRAVDAAAADPKAESIVLDINSPGGYVAGIPEAAARIAAARKVKPVVAVANHLAASAAYWLASQASSIAVSPSAEVGSIGVLSAHIDQTKLEEAMGVKTTLVSNRQSPFKTEGYPQVPLTADAMNEMQRTVDAYAQEFIATVAKGRGIRAATVERDFGQGRMKMSEEAVAARMADRIATLDQVIGEINVARTSRARRRVAADLAGMGFKTA